MVEILSPVQDFVSLSAAISAGADSVYFGIKGFNMRAGAKNFESKDIKKIVELCHKKGVKAYLALNIIIFEEEIKKAEKILKAAKKYCIDAIIAWDMAIIEIARKLKIPVHLSTQASVSNSKAIEVYKRLGISRIILARECSLKQIKKIKSASDVEIEAFVHGAMCVSVSGRCFISEYMYGKSANRGECIQPCRRKYLIKDPEEDKELVVGEDYVLSPKDLCTIEFIEKLIESGIDCFKIEGRNRSPEYVYTVTSCYKNALDFYNNNKSKKGFKQKFRHYKKELLKELKEVYNRGFSHGFYMGKPVDEWVQAYGSKSKKRKIYAGKVIHHYKNIGVAEIKLEAKGINKDDIIMVQGKSTGVKKQRSISMQKDHKDINKARKGETVAVKLDFVTRKNDKVYIIEDIK